MDRAEAWEKALENKGLVFLALGRYVKSATLHGHYTRTDLEEHLTSFAWEGMLQAVENFDESRGYRFSTYATTCIRNALHRGYRDLLSQIGGSRRGQRDGWIPETESLEGIRERLCRKYTSEYAKDPTDWDIVISPELIEADFSDGLAEELSDLEAVVSEILDGIPSARLQRLGRRFLLEGWSRATLAQNMALGQSMVSKLLTEVIDYVRFQLEAKGVAA